MICSKINSPFDFYLEEYRFVDKDFRYYGYTQALLMIFFYCPLSIQSKAVSGKQMTPAGATEIMEIIGKEESLTRIRKGIELLEAAG